MAKITVNHTEIEVTEAELAGMREMVARGSSWIEAAYAHAHKLLDCQNVPFGGARLGARIDGDFGFDEPDYDDGGVEDVEIDSLPGDDEVIAC